MQQREVHHRYHTCPLPRLLAVVPMAGYTAEAQWHSWSWDQRCSAACQAQGRGLDEPGRGDVVVSFRPGFFGILTLLAKALSHLLGYLAIGFFAKVRFTSGVSPYRKGRLKKGFLRRRRFAIFGKRR